MSRVNHKKVRKLLNEERNKITDRQFFRSRILAGHFEDIAAAQTRRYGYNRRISVRIAWDPKDKTVARTNNQVIYINAGHKLVSERKSRQTRYDMVMGLFSHELGHTLYTDFLMGQTYQNLIAAGSWYPEMPSLSTPAMGKNLLEIESYRKSSDMHLRAFLVLAHTLNNILEDGYIEDRVLAQYPGQLGDSLLFVREVVWDDMPTVTQLIDKEEDERQVFQSIMQIMLSYARFGEVKYGETPLTDERVQAVYACINEIDEALVSTNPQSRWRTVNTTIIKLWGYIQPYLELCEELTENAEDGDAANALIAAIMSALKGATEEGEGDTEPVAVIGGGATGASTGKRCAAAAAMKAAQPVETEDADSGAADENAPDEADAEREVTEASAPSEPQKVTETEQGRIGLSQTDRVSEPSGGETVYDDDFAGSGYEGSAKDVERLLEKIAESNLEEQRTGTLNELAQNVSYGNIHEGVNKVVHRIRTVEQHMVDAYNDVAPQLLHISKQLQRSISRQLQDRRRGGKQTGLYMGRRLDIHALPRNDGKVFCKNALPSEAPELAVGLLLDESGSMSSCERATYARASAIILYDFCDALDIPIMVYGHSTGMGTVDLYSYAEFDAIDRMDRYRMMDICARSSNRDGAALRYVAEQLSKRSEDMKLLILVSDGQPADSGYYGTAAEEDLRGIKQEYRRKGVHLIAAAIGDDKESIERIYGDSFLDISDLTKLPVALTAMVKRFIRA